MSNGVLQGRNTAQIEGSFVVFLLGMRINKVLKVQPPRTIKHHGSNLRARRGLADRSHELRRTDRPTTTRSPIGGVSPTRQDSKAQ